MEKLQPVIGLLARIHHRDFLSLSYPEQMAMVNQLHESRVAAIEQSQQTAKKRQTRSAKKNVAKRNGAARSAKAAENKLVKLLQSMTSEQREAFKKQAGIE